MIFWRRRSDRKIYRYWNGRQWRWADPLDLIFKITEVAREVDAEQALLMARQGNRQAFDAMVAKLHEIFATELLDNNTGRGLSIAGHVDLLSNFWAWIEAIKKKHNGGQTSFLYMVLRPFDTSADAESAPTSSGSDSTSTPSV